MLTFEWDEPKSEANLAKHGIDFAWAVLAFSDPNGFASEDLLHSQQEPRFFFYGKVEDKILTVRFTIRHGKIRVIGAGHWREGRKVYEKRNTPKENGKDGGAKGQ